MLHILQYRKKKLPVAITKIILLFMREEGKQKKFIIF